MTAENKNMLVFGYVRVSTENQIENYSIDEQIQRLNAYCAARGWIMLKIYTDGGYSGGNTDRPALKQMLADIRTTKVDAVLVYKLDRLSRSQKDTLMLIEDELLAHNVDFVSINENFDTSSPFGRAMIGILSVFAQLEKDQITERFTMGRIGRGKAGYYHGGSIIPMGYVYNNGELEVDPDKAVAVREIFDAFLRGKTINAIWHDMESRYGGHWSAAKVRIILLNSVYTGKVKFAGVEYDGRHEPIISKEDFAAVQHLFASFDRENGKNAAQKSPFRAGFLLSSLIYCGRCGAKYSAAHGFYKCYSRSKTSKKNIVDPGCKNDNWLIEKLDAFIVDEVRNLLDSPELLSDLLKHASKGRIEVDVKKVHRRIADIDKQIGKVVDLYQVGAIPMDVIVERVNTLDAEKQRLNAELNAAASGGKSRDEYFAEAVAAFRSGFDAATLEERRQLIGGLVEKITVDGQNIQLSWRI